MNCEFRAKVYVRAYLIFWPAVPPALEDEFVDISGGVMTYWSARGEERKIELMERDGVYISSDWITPRSGTRDVIGHFACGSTAHFRNRWWTQKLTEVPHLRKHRNSIHQLYTSNYPCP